MAVVLALASAVVYGAADFLGGLASTVFFPLTAWLMASWGWRHALLSLAALHLLVCAPLHWLTLRGAPRARDHERRVQLSGR